MNTLTTRTYAHARMHVHMAGRRHGEDLPLGPCNWGCDYTFTYIYMCVYIYVCDNDADLGLFLFKVTVTSD